MQQDSGRVQLNIQVVRDLEPTHNTRLVKYEDLNHHRTLFAGRGAEWLIEACFISAARCVGRPEDVVCVQIQGMTFRKPTNRGDLVEIESQVGHVGTKSITVVARATTNGDPQSAVTCIATFVTTDESGKPRPHGIVLPQAYVAANRALCDEAKAAYEAGRKGGA